MPPRTFGDAESGFSVEHNAGARIVRVRAWGFWRLEVAAGFARAVVSECRVGETVGLLVDVTHLLPQRNEGQTAFGELMIALRTIGLVGVAVVVSSTITKMQLLRIAKERGVRDWSYFSSDLEAMATMARENQPRR